jgi:phospholipid/cholesterol/gamma-HCH transport system substrate-binding protein
MLRDLLRYRANAAYVGAVLLAAFIVFLGVAYMINRSFALNFWDPGYQLKADFVDADGIANASDIRIAGVYVGQVTELRSVSGGLAEITFRLDSQHAPMHRGTKANLRLQTLLGQKFIELVPGPADAGELAANSVIPTAQTTSPVDFDQFLSTFNKPTRDALGSLITEAGTATDGRGQDINALLADFNQLSVQSAPDLQTFADRSDHINHILVTAADVTQNLADNRDHLAAVLTHLNSVLGTVAANDAEFRKLIHEGNLGEGHGLTQLAGEQQNINDTIRLLRPLLQHANPAVEDVTAVGNQFQGFINIAKAFTTNLLGGISGYNNNNAPLDRVAQGVNSHNPEFGVCNTEGQPTTGPNAVGCGGPYLRQPTVLVQAPPPPGQTVDCENANPDPSCPAGARASAALGAERSILNYLLGQ